MDVELASTSTGAKAFTALKRAMDEELDNSHTEHRSLGYDIEAKPLDDVHRAHIFGQHEANYTKDMSEEDEKRTRRNSTGTSRSMRPLPVSKACIPRLMLLFVLTLPPRPRLLLQK